jgi:predicted P-loop ATPase
VDSINWDGEPRCEHFLHEWAKVEDSPYSREVSRLIFAGGIHRLYAPGTKFDDVPILIGTKQGEGKSSLIRFLAIHDQYYGEVNMMEGQQAIEQLRGKWICEISELLALTKSKEQEAAKAYITRQVDTYRKPWDKNPSDLPRRCIMIGTTNSDAPLTDKTGNRRYYPVEVHCNGYDLFDHEQECRDYILQCWAEARELYKRGRMPNYADRKLTAQYREAQENATQDDWRVGAIAAFLERKNAGELTCVREVAHRALSPNPDFPKEPSLVESKDIGAIITRLPGWEKVGNKRIGIYGVQRCWMKKENPPTKKADGEFWEE